MRTQESESSVRDRHETEKENHTGATLVDRDVTPPTSRSVNADERAYGVDMKNRARVVAGWPTVVTTR